MTYLLSLAMLALLGWGAYQFTGAPMEDPGTPYDPKALPAEWRESVGHFALSEFLVTSKPSLQRVPRDPQIRAGIMRLIAVVLEPLRARFGPIRITSGYRSSAVNTAVGGSATSDHRRGYAADLKAVSNHDARAMAQWLATSPIPFDQAIWYEQVCGGHLHISMRPSGNRREVLHCVVTNGKKNYKAEV